MITGIDHLVIAVKDLEAATRAYGELGFTVVPGGRHPVGTYNTLIAFADGSYIELIGFYRDNPDHRWWTALQRGGGLVDYCLQTDDLMGDTRAFRDAGVDIADPVSQSRVRPDGYQLRWVFSLARGPYRGVAPFLINDETPREERVPREVAHPNGVTGIEALTVAVRDASELRKIYTRVCGNVARDLRRDDLAGAGFAVRFGPHGVELLSPASSTGPLADRLRARGPGPYAVRLRTRGGTPGPLDQARTLGVPLTLV